jgi:hypothetical protein
MTRRLLCLLALLATPTLLSATTTPPAAAAAHPVAPKPATPKPVAARTSCLTCHQSPDYFDDDEIASVRAMANDIHGKLGLSCHDCHGGNPDLALADDQDAAMDEHFKNPFRGAPSRAEIPSFCGRCHSDPLFMKRYHPDPRIDQEKEYWTSRHGELLKTGDTKVATCVDCHGYHGVKGPDDSTSPVHPTHVAETCARCHGDAERMSAYKLPDGRPLPTDQYDHWRASVHAATLLERGDLSAPTCNDCHGNHGATPPGVGSLAFVCGQCHGREAELFRKSAKSTDFEEHNGLLADAGPDGCRSCHDAPEPPALLQNVHAFSECTTCHGNHGVVAPRVTMLGLLPQVPCALCHEPNSTGAPVVEEQAEQRRHYLQVRDELLAEAARQKLEGDARFDWLIDRMRGLPFHTEVDEKGGRALRPEVQRLYTKFRLGKTTVTTRNAKTGAIEHTRLRQCADCHGGDDVSGGLATARSFRDQLQELTSLIGRAQRIVLAAKRGGVPVGDAAEQIDAAVDAQIQLQVLVHTFDPKGAFAAKHREGIAHASAALNDGQNALDELAYRHRGLGVSLAVIALVLVALALKIRQLPAGE